MNEKDNVLREEKKRKLKALLEKNLNPYPHNFKPTHNISQIRTQKDTASDPTTNNKQKDTASDPTASNKPSQNTLKDDPAGEKIKTAGRLMLKRNMGKAAFFNIQDQSGNLQCYIKTQEVDQSSVDYFSLVDVGDIVGVEGEMFHTKKGEWTLRCKQFWILCKSIEPLPEKYHGIEDTELKYRRRYLDLIMNPESKKVFLLRSKVIKEIRNFLDQKGFLEVDTPVLQPLYGGAEARPFSTHHHALDCKLYLKISPELYLKKLIAGGFEKVYELGKNFRNEGIDRSHNPEFMMLEYYEAYTDYIDQMQQFEELICHVTQSVKGSLKLSYQDKPLDLTPPWKRISVAESIKEKTGVEVEKKSDQELFDKIKSLGSDLESPVKRGEMIMEMFELTVEKHLWDPVFITDFPKDVSPLTKEHRSHPHLVERFEPFIAGMELGNAYTELNDPVEQTRRLKAQERRKNETEHHPMDYDFVEAVETGLPPTGGVGLGVERLVLLLADERSIRDIILFPTLKPDRKKQGKK